MLVFPRMLLPHDKSIDVKVLAQIYNNTTATYKFYWFASILDILVKEGKNRMSFWEIIVGMIAEAWYPIHYFLLSFGKSDSLYKQILELQQTLNIPIDASKSHIKRSITDNFENRQVKELLRVFTLNVPYRFLSPWIRYTNDPAVESESRRFANNCLYAINGERIEINPSWVGYLTENYVILKEFTFWNLTLFLQKRNPNVPDLSSKLVKPVQRDSLLKQHRFWDTFININGSLKCIYTGTDLHIKMYDLDHFIPWSFVSHNLLWNLLPADPRINSSKSNDLPSLNLYLGSFSEIHKTALETIYYRDPNNKLLEDYLFLYGSLSELVQLSHEDFYEVYKKTFSPLVQIAENMGFKYWRNIL